MGGSGITLPPVVVVGAGIVGAAVAYETARAGADVVLLDKGLPGSGATGVSFAWIGGPRSWDAPDGSAPLNRRALAAWRRLEGDVPGVRVRWRGSLRCNGTGDDHLGALQPEERILGAAEVEHVEPHLRERPERAVHVAEDGAVDPVAVTQALVEAAQGEGARPMPHRAVTSLRVRDGRVLVETSAGSLACRTVVVAAGIDAPALCAPLGFRLPVTPSPALLMRFSGPPGLVRTLVVAPGFEVREAADGSLLVAAEYRGEKSPEELRRAGLEMLQRLTAAFRVADLRLIDVRPGARPMPEDGLPVVGPIPGADGVYVAVMHAGVTLAPVVGRLVAAEIVEGIEAAELAGVRPARFQPPPPRSRRS